MIPRITYWARSTTQRLTNQAGLNPDAVFVWIPKSAGTSVYNSLQKLGCPKLKTVNRIRRVFPQRGLVTFGHLDYNRLVTTGIVSKEFDRKAKKFTIVRDPYDRAISLYFYVMRRSKLFDNWHSLPSFEDFLELIESGFYDKIGLFNVQGLSQANPQVAWTKNISFDTIGRIENLPDAMAQIGDLLGRDIPHMEWLNKGEVADTSGLLTKTTISMIDRIYAEDFETFGYERRRG